MSKPCKDCEPGSKRPAPHPGPRCATHHRARRRAVSAAAHGRRLVRPRVSDPEAAAQVQDPGRVAQLRADPRHEIHHDLHGRPEALEIEDLRSDMAMEARQAQHGQLKRPLDRRPGAAIPDAETELRVLLAGLDVVVGMRFHARRQPEKDPRLHGQGPGQFG